MKTTLEFSKPEQMLDPPALAAMLRISVRHLSDVRRDDPTFPAPRMFGTLPRWSPDAIRAWMWSGPSTATTVTAGPETAPAPRRRGREERGRVQ